MPQGSPVISCMARKSPRDFRAYATIEAANIVLVPGAALLIAPPVETAEILSMALAIGACAGFLLVGARYWRSLDQRLRGVAHGSMTRTLVFADAVEKPLIFLTAASA